MSNWPACDATLQRAHNEGSTWNYCSIPHCDNLQNYNHDFCSCKGQFSVYPYVQKGVCMTAPGSLIPIADKGCFCCCSCLAYDTPIAVSKKMVKAVQDFAINDMVLVAKDSSLKSWEQKPVLFSNGTGAKGRNKLIKIHFGDQTEGITVGPESFVSALISKTQSANYFKILSTAPNDYIGKDGLVNLTMVRRSNIQVISQLLGNPIKAITQYVYDVLKVDENFLLATAIQPFLMKDKTLKQAQKLVPGQDELVLADGSTTPIVSLEVGMFEKGVHHIATSQTPATSMDGHLMIANGIVVGDYSLQISLASSGSSISDKHVDAPDFGTKAYNDQHRHLSATLFSAYVAKPKKKSGSLQKVDSFTNHHRRNSAVIPRNAYKYITRRQARELLLNAPMYPASNNVAEPSVNYLFTLFQGFYPDITFYYDHDNMTPNAYSFEQYGKKFVVITCGWTLVEGVYFQGIAMTIAHMVNALNQQGSVPHGVSPVGEADYNVYPSFLSLFYFAQDATKNYNLALAQIKTVFGYITKRRIPSRRISLDCRIQTLEASINALPLPQCAGGPPDPALKLVEASATIPKGADKPVVSIKFNLPVDQATAVNIGNYFFDPKAIAFSATVDEDDPTLVYLIADLLPDTEYYLVVTGVLSVDLHPMVVGSNGYSFTLSTL